MLELKNINKYYNAGDEKIHALKNIDLEFKRAEFVSILGPSGCGKTTLLNVLGGLANYDDGDLLINGQSTNEFTDENWDSYRNHQIGFVFQSYNLINHLTVLANVELALSLTGESVKKRREKAREMLIKVGLGDKLNKRPNQLSNGQIQRVAIARSLVNDPKIILADEPTGALDSETSIQIMELLKELADDRLIIMVTHNQELAEQYSDRIINLLDGKILDDTLINNFKREALSIHKNLDQKTYMGFGTAVKLSFFNLLKKYLKTIISAVAGGIGIIGIGVVIGISIGFTRYVNIVQLTTNTNSPIMVRNKTVVEAFPDPNNPAAVLPPRFPTNQNYITPQQTQIPYIYESVVNFITPEYINHVDSIDPSLYHQIKYYYDLNFPTFYRKDNIGNLYEVNYSTSNSADIGEIPYDEKEYLAQMFDVLAGKLPNNEVIDGKAEGILIISDRNQLPDIMLNRLGYNLDLDNINTYDVQIPFSELLNINIKIAHSGFMYEENSETNLFVRRNDEDIYSDENIIDLKIVGILRRKQNAAIPQYQGIRYTSGVNTYILENTQNSAIVLKQQELINNYDNHGDPITSVLTGDNITKNQANILLRQLGISQEPSRIVIYHKDTESREKIVNYLEEYNLGKPNDQKIILEQSSMQETWIVDGTLSAIRIVLVVVAAIALFISVSLLSILTYISVIQRTQEIGILRSIGARKKDITRVFNAEAFIIGLLSGVLGLILTYILQPVFNTVFEAALNVRQLINIDFPLAMILLFGNIALTLVIGYIPAIIASRKDPIDALRSTD